MRLQNGLRRRFFISSSSSDPDGTQTVAAAAAISALTCDSGINSLWEQLIVFLTHVTERTSPSSKTHHTGLWNVLLFSAVGASQQLHVERKSYMSFLSSIYADLFQQVLCVSLFFFCCFCFFYQCKSTPFAGLKGQEVTHSLPPPKPSVTHHTVARPHGLA